MKCKKGGFVVCNLTILQDRSLIELKGPDTKDFLQGLITNDINKIDSKGIIYCAMLNPKGRFLYDFFIFKAQNSIFLDVFAPKIDEIIKKLSFYRLKKDVNIEKNTDLSIYSLINGEIDGEFEYIFQDPRSKNMGFRGYFKDHELGDSKVRSDETEYEFTRIKNKITESEKDLTYEKSVIAEYGLDDLNAIDYEKGCYIGQELTARTHYLGQIRKKIFFCKFAEPIVKNSEIFVNDQKIGLALSSIKYDNIIYGLILIKVSDDFDKNTATLTSNNIKIEILD